MRRYDDWDGPPAVPGIEGPLFTTPEPVREEGPFDFSTIEPDKDQRAVATLIWKHRGWPNAIPIARITEITGIEDRVVKKVVEALRKKHFCAIGPRHLEPAGYFWIVDDEDRKAACTPFRSQVLAMWDTLRVLDSRDNNKNLLEEMRNRL